MRKTPDARASPHVKATAWILNGPGINCQSLKAQDVDKRPHLRQECSTALKPRLSHAPEAGEPWGRSVAFVPVRFLLTLLAGLTAGTEMCWNKLFAGFQKPYFP